MRGERTYSRLEKGPCGTSPQSLTNRRPCALGSFVGIYFSPDGKINDRLTAAISEPATLRRHPRYFHAHPEKRAPGEFLIRGEDAEEVGSGESLVGRRVAF